MSLDRRQTLAQALEQCAREPVHIPGGIQDCGALLSVDAGFARIHQASANLGAFFDIEAGAAIGLAPEAVVGRRARWREADVRAAQALAENLTVALSVSRIAQLNERLAHTNQRLRELAQTDSLTGLWNRYRMEQEIDEALATAERYARPFALLLFDVDHFKRVNDTWGHDVGDQVLIGLAGLARSLLRETDHLGRWGGEEFVLLAGDTGPEDAAVVAERLRREIAAARFPPAGQVTVSIGVASGQPGEPRRMLVKRADAALYQAKHEGRNRVMQAP